MQKGLRPLYEFAYGYPWRDEVDMDEMMRLLGEAEERVVALPSDKDGNPLTLGSRFSYDGGCFSVVGIDASGVFYNDPMTAKMRKGYGFKGSLSRYIVGSEVRRVPEVDESKWDVYEAPRRCSAYRWEGDFITDGEYDCPQWCQDALRNGLFKFKDQAELYLEDEHVPVGAYLVRYPDGAILWCSEENYQRGFMTAEQVCDDVKGEPERFGVQ